MPEVKHAVRSAAEKARAINHIGLALDQRIEQVGIIGRIVFQIGVLNQYIVSRGFLYPAPKRRTLSHIFRLQQNP